MKKILGMLALLTMMTPVVAGELIEVTEASTEAVAGWREVSYVQGEQREVLYLQSPPLIVTEDVAVIATCDDPTTIRVALSEEGAKKFAEKTKAMAGKRIAIVVQGKVVSAPGVRFALGRNFFVSGFKDETESKGFVEAFEKRGK